MANVVFMGTPDFAVPSLRQLLAHYPVVGVVTQPDRPAGRGGQVRQSPVKQVASIVGVPIYQPEKLRGEAALETLRRWKADVYVVAAFGQILPQAVLDIPPYGSVNVHASLLPRWRGAAPIQAAIRAGDEQTGVTIMRMDAGLDTGPILSQRAIPIQPDETGQSLHDKLAPLGANLLTETLAKYLAGEIQPQPQGDAQATYAPMIKKEEGHINWTTPAIGIERLVRAFTPWPGTFSYWDDTLLKIHAGQAGPGQAPPGQVVRREGRIAIGTGEGLFYPGEVQLAGKKRVTVEDFVNGYPDFIGVTLT